jgi:amino acid transporter
LTNREAAGNAGFVRAIGRFDLTAAVINGVIGSGIFGLPAILAATAGTLSPLAALAAAGGIGLIALCFAEVASRFREHGGVYLYSRAAYGPLVGFEVGWLLVWTRLLSAAANLNLFVLYLAELWPEVAGGAPRAIVMMGLAGTVAVMNVVGVRSAARAIDFFTIAKLLPLALLIVLGCRISTRRPSPVRPCRRRTGPSQSWSSCSRSAGSSPRSCRGRDAGPPA